MQETPAAKLHPDSSAIERRTYTNSPLHAFRCRVARARRHCGGIRGSSGVGVLYCSPSLIGGIEMMNAKVSGVRSIELGVRDLQQSADFYTKVWALEQVGSEGDATHLRGTGSEHHLLTIRQRPKPALLGVNFAAPDRAAVDQLCAKAKSYGVKVSGDPAPMPGSSGGGYGFRFETPEGLPMSISSDATEHNDVALDRS